MSNNLNKVMLIGHLGSDIKIHNFEGGGCIGNTSLATNESYTNKQTGEKVENTDWHNLVFRNKAAEVCEKYLEKGDKIFIEGKLKNRSYEDQNGQKKYVTEIHVLNFEFLSTKKSNNTIVNEPQTVAHNNNQNDDLPF